MTYTRPYWLLLLCVPVCVHCSFNMTTCPFDCFNNGECVNDVCICNFPSNDNCETSWLEGEGRSLFYFFVVFFCIVFGIIALAASAQLARFIYLTGWAVTAPKVMFALVTLMGPLQITALGIGARQLLAPIESHGDTPFQLSVFDNVLNGLGVSVLIICFLLSLFLWLQVYDNVTQDDWWVSKRRRWILAITMIFYVGVEVTLRISWRLFKQPTNSILLIAYQLFVGVTLVILCLVFVGLSLRLYRTMGARGDAMQIQKDRMDKIVKFSFVTLAVGGCSILFICISFAVEMTIYHWRNWDSWIIEQMAFLSVEAAYSIGILVCLRKVPSNEIRPRHINNHIASLDADSPPARPVISPKRPAAIFTEDSMLLSPTLKPPDFD